MARGSYRAARMLLQLTHIESSFLAWLFGQESTSGSSELLRLRSIVDGAFQATDGVSLLASLQLPSYALLTAHHRKQLVM